MKPTQMEPLLPQDQSQALENLAVELVAKANQLSGQVKPEVRDSIGDLVRSMNCYYSNLIEGHNTHPRDINSALIDDHYSDDPKKRALQKEATAHIEVQRMIDAGATPEAAPTSPEFIRWIHYEFCRRLPDDLLWVENPDTKQRVQVVPGEFRDGAVRVGRHVPPPADDIESFPKLDSLKFTVATICRASRKSSLSLLRIIGLFGSIRFTTAMAGSSDSCRMQCCSNVVLAVVCGPSRAVLHETVLTIKLD